MPTYEFSAFVTATADTEDGARKKGEELTDASSRSPEGVRVSLDDGSAEIVDDDELPSPSTDPLTSLAERIGFSLLRWTRLVDDDDQLIGTSEAVEAFVEALQHSSIPEACHTMADAQETR
jgi:hypothetical protein